MLSLKLLDILHVESCGVNNKRISLPKTISLEAPIILPKETCEKIWAREVQRLDDQQDGDYSFAKVLCTGNYRKPTYGVFEYSEVTGYVYNSLTPFTSQITSKLKLITNTYSVYFMSIYVLQDFYAKTKCNGNA